MEYGPMSERILRSMERIVKSDPDLKDFALIPDDNNTKNKNPVIYEDHHLGLETWCTKYVYEYVCSQLFKIRPSLANAKLNRAEQEDLNHLLIGALFINPDVNTFWNMRRELVVANILGCDEELQFSKLVLTRKTKSNEAFAYRRWLLHRILEKMTKNGVRPPQTLLETEQSVCTLTTENTPNNYHSWNHRQWCVITLGVYFPSLIPDEMSFSEQWLSEHVSENTGYHYRQFLIEKWREKGCDRIHLRHYYGTVVSHLNIFGDELRMLRHLLGLPGKFGPRDSLFDMPKDRHLDLVLNYIILLLYELLWVIETIDNVFAAHECLWLHRRFVLQKLLEVSSEYLAETVTRPRVLECTSTSNIIDSISADNDSNRQPKMFKSQPTRFQFSNLQRIMYESEKEFLDKDRSENPAEVDLVNRHKKWVKLLLGYEPTTM